MKNLLNQKNRYLVPIEAFFLYCWLVNLQGTDSYYSVYILVAVTAAYAMHCNYNRKSSLLLNRCKGCFIMAAGFSAAVVLANYGLFMPVTSIQCLVEAGCTLLGGWIAFAHILIWAVSIFPLKISGEDRVHSTLVFSGAFAFFATIFLSHLFFRAFPGILTGDSVSTIRQILNGEYNNTMPFWHTITVEFFVNIGLKLFGEINSAIAFFHGFQCLFMAACFAYAIVTLYQTGIPYVAVGAALLCYGIIPYNIVYSVTLWKDVLFGSAALLMVTSLLRLFRNLGKHKKLNLAVFILGSVGLCLWRTNGLLAFGSLLVVMALFLRKKYKYLLLIMVVIFIVCWILTSPLLTLLNIPGTDYVEALAIPFQQISRVVALDLPLTESEHQMLSEVFFLDLVKEKYDPGTVDPIKFEAMRRRTPLTQEPLAYMGLWIRLGLKYPGTYLAAWIEETKGYWNGGYSFWIYTYQMSENALGIAAAHGENIVASLFKAVFRYLEKFSILQPLYSIGLHVWITVICCFVNAKKHRDDFLLSLPGIMIILGLMIGTPVFAEFRYAYPVFTTLPVILCSTVYSAEVPKE